MLIGGDSLAVVNTSRAERAVAQLGSALEWGSRGRGFKSRRPEFVETNLGRRRDELGNLYL